jgi:hypothetical protein
LATTFDELIVEHGVDSRFYVRGKDDKSNPKIDVLDAYAEEFYQHAEQIPNQALYELLLMLRTNLINTMQLGTEHVTKSRLGEEVRHRCQTDLMWMARYFTWCSNPASDNGIRPFEENIFDEEFYGPYTKLFPKKDPSKPINKQSDVKTFLLLWPRGGAKSTFDHVDTVQWILCFPHVRILYLTAEKDLAVGFVGEVKGHFYLKEDPTWMNIFWPEFCVEEGKAGAGNEFTCPVYAAKKTGRKEPTVYASSVGKSKAGWRYEVIKADDAVSDTNSETTLLCSKVSNHLFLAEKLLALGGNTIFYIGTRYAGEDHYGILLDKNVGEIVTTTGKGWEFLENKTTNTNILIGRAMQIKPEVRERLEREGRPVTYHEAGEEGCILLLPHLMSYSWCMADFIKDEKSFEGQRNQNPRNANRVGFDRAALLRATVPFSHLPREGPCSQVWDLASSLKKGSDFTVGTSVIWGEEPVIDALGQRTDRKQTVAYVRRIIRDRMLPHQIVQNILKLAKEEHPFIVAIENAQGASYLKDSLEQAAIRTCDQYLIDLIRSIDWFTPDQQKEAKYHRMGSLHPWISEGRFKFANYCMESNPPPLNKIEIVYNEFERCMTEHHHDDIPDNLGYQTGKFAPRATIALVENNREIYSTNIDRMGWSEVFDENHQPNTGPAYYLDDNGNMTPLYAEPANLTELFTPEPEAPSHFPSGMQNILGIGMNG